MSDRYLNRSFPMLRWISAVTLAITPWLVNAGGAFAQLTDPASQTPPPEQSEGLDELRPLSQSTTSLSIAGGKQLMADAEAAISNQNYDLAIAKLKAARETFNQLSNYYQELATLFIGVDSRITQSHRQNALETAQLRDRASYQLALVYRAQDQPDLAVPLLMEILQSQQPTRPLGQQAYQQLFELGFVDEPYAGNTPSSSSQPQ